MSRFVRMMVAFLAIIVFLSATFAAVAVALIGERVLAEARNRVASDLNAAEQMYDAYSDRLYDLIRLSADQPYLQEALRTGELSTAGVTLAATMVAERLDFLTVTDANGVVVMRAANPDAIGDSQRGQSVVAAALGRVTPVAGIAVLSSDMLRRESPSSRRRPRSGWWRRKGRDRGLTRSRPTAWCSWPLPRWSTGPAA